MDEATSFGQELKQCRTVMHLTREALARQVNCAVITLRRIEADELRPSRQLAELLASALELPLSERTDFVRLARATGGQPGVPVLLGATSTVALLSDTSSLARPDRPNPYK